MMKKNLQGYTLMELMVSVAIIGIIFGIFLTNYKEGGRRADFQMTAQNLASNIRMVQGNSMALKDFKGGGLGGGWGIHFNRDDSKYEIFVDNNPVDRFYTVNEKFAEIKFGNGIKIADEVFEGIDSSGAAFTGNQRNFLSVIFEPPNPLVHIDARFDDTFPAHVNDKEDNTLVYIKLVNISGDEKVLTINRFGMVEIE